MCIDGFIEAISDAISRGEQVDLRGLGTFAIRQTAPRKIAFANNAAIVPSHGRIVFRPGEKLRMSAWNNAGAKNKSS
jgi:nucleoid DNA-binding protein